MAIGANSYGSVAGVEALSWRFTNAGSFDGTTKPTLVQVESWIDQVSGVINLTLAGCRYTTLPITIDTIIDTFDLYVNQITADIVEGSHDIGRLGPTALTNARTGSIKAMWGMVAGEVATFIRDQCDAFEYLGLDREAESQNSGLLTTTAMTRQDGYSNDLNAVETARLT